MDRRTDRNTGDYGNRGDGLARAVLGAGVSVTEQPGDFVILPKSAMGEIAWYRVMYRLAYAFCFGAGAMAMYFLLNRMFTTAAMLAFSL
jgi:hypothetical protein